MASENEPAKLLLPYLQRADELQKHEPLVAYYCRLYAMERGLKIPQSERTKTTNEILVSVMKRLEKDKKSLQLGPDDYLHLEGFASNVFSKADKQDRAGRADLNTAKTFYAASIFFEILNQFGEVQPDLEQKQKYAAWKAVDIRKAMKEGRKPVPGPPGGDKDQYDLEPSRSDPVTKPAPELDPSSQLYDKVDPDQFSNILPSPSSNIPSSSPSHIPPSPPSHNSPSPTYPTDEYPSHSSNIPPPPSQISPSPTYPTEEYPFHSSNIPPPPSQISPSPTYPTEEYPSHNFQQYPSPNRGENSTYSQPYHHQQYPQEPQHHLPQNFPPHEPSYTYPNFQSYPSFSESTLPAAPSDYPSYYQSSDTSYSSPSGSKATNYSSTAQYDSSGLNGTASEPAPTSAQVYQYDSNYQPPPEKIAEAHKAARFAVGALAFDDVFVAVDYLKKSLELLTKPSAGH